MCKKGGVPPKFEIRADISQTMAEMMQALMARGNGNGGVGGSGSGSGGSGQDGFSVAGKSTNIPVYGPDRLAFSDPTGLSGRHGTSRAGKKPTVDQQPKNQVKAQKHRDPEQSKIITENIPEKYKPAVKRYFSQ